MPRPGCSPHPRYEQARAYGGEALALFEQNPAGEKEIGDALNALGLIAPRENELERAEDHLRRATGYWRRLEMPANLGRTLNNLAQVLQRQDKHEAALNLYQEALGQLALTYSTLDQLRVRNSLGTLYFKLEQHDQAEIHFREVYRLAVRHGGDVSLQGTLLHQSEFDEAERYLRNALDIWHQLAHEVALANCLGALGEVHAGRQQMEQAAAFFRQALDLLEKHPDDAWAKRLSRMFSAELAALPELPASNA